MAVWTTPQTGLSSLRPSAPERRPNPLIPNYPSSTAALVAERRPCLTLTWCSYFDTYSTNPLYRNCWLSRFHYLKTNFSSWAQNGNTKVQVTPAFDWTNKFKVEQMIVLVVNLYGWPRSCIWTAGVRFMLLFKQVFCAVLYRQLHLCFVGLQFSWPLAFLPSTGRQWGTSTWCPRWSPSLTTPVRETKTAPSFSFSCLTSMRP